MFYSEYYVRTKMINPGENKVTCKLNQRRFLCLIYHNFTRQDARQSISSGCFILDTPGSLQEARAVLGYDNLLNLIKSPKEFPSNSAKNERNTHGFWSEFAKNKWFKIGLYSTQNGSGDSIRL